MLEHVGLERCQSRAKKALQGMPRRLQLVSDKPRPSLLWPAAEGVAVRWSSGLGHPSAFMACPKAKHPHMRDRKTYSPPYRGPL